MLEALNVRRLLRLLATAPTSAKARLGSNVELLINFLVIVAALAFMLFQGAGFAIRITQLFAIFAILAVSLNLILGYTGLISIAHVALFGIGAYTVAVLTTSPAYEQVPGHIPHFEWAFFAALPVGMAIAGVVALFVGGVLSRFRDDFFVLVSVGFAVIAHRVFLFLAASNQGPIWHPCDSQTFHRRHGNRRQPGVSDALVGLPGPRVSGVLADRPLLLWPGIDGHPGG